MASRIFSLVALPTPLFTLLLLCLPYMHSHFNHIYMYILPQSAWLTGVCATFNGQCHGNCNWTNLMYWKLSLKKVTFIASLLYIACLFTVVLFLNLPIVPLTSVLHYWLEPVSKHFTVVFGSHEKINFDLIWYDDGARVGSYNKTTKEPGTDGINTRRNAEGYIVEWAWGHHTDWHIDNHISAILHFLWARGNVLWTCSNWALKRRGSAPVHLFRTNIFKLYVTRQVS